MIIQPLIEVYSGGGISGLSLALVLKKFMTSSTLTVDLYEAESAFTEVGAGITVWQRTRSIFASLGLQAALDNRAVSPPMKMRKSDTKEPFAFHTLVIPRKFLNIHYIFSSVTNLLCAADGSIALPRLDMVQLLVENLQPDSTPFLTIHFSKKLNSYNQDADGVTLRFSDGSSSRADLLVGADGIGSLTRKTMYAGIAERVAQNDSAKAALILQGAQPTWTGTYAYRTLLESEKLRAVSPENVMLSSGLMVRSLFELRESSLMRQQWCGTGKV